MAERHGTNSKHPRRRLAARRPVAAYGRTVQRCRPLILIASAPFLIGERPQSWDVLAGAGALAHVAAFLKFDAWSIFAIIGMTSPWILPMVGRSARACLARFGPTTPEHRACDCERRSIRPKRATATSVFEIGPLNESGTPPPGIVIGSIW